MTDEGHANLAAKLNAVKGAVIVSGYHSELYDELYKGWHKEERKSMTDAQEERIEVLWMKGIKHDPGLFERDL
jgi:DNA adenine methylase